MPPAHHSHCLAQADPPACHPHGFTCPCHARAPLAPRSRLRPWWGLCATRVKSQTCATTPARDGDLPAPRAPFLRQEASLATGWGSPQRSQYLLSLQLTLGLRNAGSAPARLPGEVAVCRGARGHPLAAALFIFSIFVEGNESWGRGMRGQRWAGGAGSVSQGSASEEGWPALPNHHTHTPAILPGVPWTGSTAVGLLSRSVLILQLGHLLG